MGAPKAAGSFAAANAETSCLPNWAKALPGTGVRLRRSLLRRSVSATPVSTSSSITTPDFAETDKLRLSYAS